MGLPYSKQINAAFDQVTPLVAAGFEVLQTTKNISLLLAVIQVLTVILLAFILAALFALLITVNPQLEDERNALVTPTVKALAGILVRIAEFQRALVVACWVVVLGAAIGGAGGLYYTRRDPALLEEEFDGSASEVLRQGEDIEAIKKGESKQ